LGLVVYSRSNSAGFSQLYFRRYGLSVFCIDAQFRLRESPENSLNPVIAVPKGKLCLAWNDVLLHRHENEMDVLLLAAKTQRPGPKNAPK
jgi:hypothetical protein